MAGIQDDAPGLVPPVFDVSTLELDDHSIIEMRYSVPFRVSLRRAALGGLAAVVLGACFLPVLRAQPRMLGLFLLVLAAVQGLVVAGIVWPRLVVHKNPLLNRLTVRYRRGRPRRYAWSLPTLACAAVRAERHPSRPDWFLWRVGLVDRAGAWVAEFRPEVTLGAPAGDALPPRTAEFLKALFHVTGLSYDRPIIQRDPADPGA